MTSPTLQGSPSIPSLQVPTGATSVPSTGRDHLCRLAGVCRSGYYRQWQAIAPRQEETNLRDAVQRLALANRRYGYRRISALLHREGWNVNHKRVLRVMHDDNLLCLRSKSFFPRTTNSSHEWRIVPNLARGLVLTDIDQLWVADITYIHMIETFSYLAIVLDAFSRKVIGWALEEHLKAELAITALNMAIERRSPTRGQIIHHSDRGVQYACADYTKRLKECDIRPSMSRVGNPYDNAKAESFMKTLKQEEVNATTYKDANDARNRIGAFLEETYNRQRIHSALSYLTPDEYESENKKRARENTRQEGISVAGV
jgi:transposase InsO family protein